MLKKYTYLFIFYFNKNRFVRNIRTCSARIEIDRKYNVFVFMEFVKNYSSRKKNCLHLQYYTAIACIRSCVE